MTENFDKIINDYISRTSRGERCQFILVSAQLPKFDYQNLSLKESTPAKITLSCKKPNFKTTHDK